MTWTIDATPTAKHQILSVLDKSLQVELRDKSYQWAANPIDYLIRPRAGLNFPDCQVIVYDSEVQPGLRVEVTFDMPDFPNQRLTIVQVASVFVTDDDEA